MADLVLMVGGFGLGPIAAGAAIAGLKIWWRKRKGARCSGRQVKGNKGVYHGNHSCPEAV